MPPSAKKKRKRSPASASPAEPLKPEPSHVVGIDPSLRCPALCRLDTAENLATICWWPTRKREARVPELQRLPVVAGGRWTVLLRRMPAMPDDDSHCMGRARDVSRALAALLDEPDGASPENTRVATEGYAFGAGSGKSRGAGHSHRLAELGGVIRQSLFLRGYAWSEHPPTSIKKHFSGRGGADKEAMLGAFLDRHKMPDVSTRFGFVDNAPFDHPVEDVVDAFAAAVLELDRATGASQPPKPKPPKKRRKKCVAPPDAIVVV
jgi:hypothetical protein